MAYNKWTGVGRLTRDPELQKVGNDLSLCKFSIAVDRSYGKDKEGVDFINCEAWRERGEMIAAHKVKGDQVLIEGRLKIDQYEKDGQKRTAAVVVVNDIQYLSSKGGGGDGSTEAATNEADFDDIPF